jgi:hypothetical protein
VFGHYHKFGQSDLEPGERIILLDDNVHLVGSGRSTRLILTDRRLIYLQRSREGKVQIGKGFQIPFTPLSTISQVRGTDEVLRPGDKLMMPIGMLTHRALYVSTGTSVLQFWVAEPHQWADTIQGQLSLH